MKSEKVLYVKELYFNLPEDFEGTTADALQLATNYRKERELKGEIGNSEEKFVGESNIDIFWNNEDIKCVMSSAMGKVNEDGEVFEQWD